LDVIVNNDTVCTGPQAIIQFVTTSNTVLEGTSNCNTGGSQSLFIDLSIGTAPSADAVVTFQMAGTADAQDYSISPASVTFNAGVTTNQTLTVNINEDAYIESNEDLQITYTINPNGGDAIAGSSNQSYTININNDDFDPNQATVTVLDENFNDGSAGWTINDGGSTTDTWEWTTQGSNLDGSSFMFVNSDNVGNGNTMDEELISPVMNTAGMTDLILEFDQYINVYGPGTVETFEVDVWDGSAWQNVFFWDENDGDIGDWGDPDRPSIDISAYANSALQVRFKYVSGYDWWWAIDNVNITANSSVAIQLDNNSGLGFAEHDLGPFQTVHFYDTNTGNIMLTIENTSGHDYGCTFVEVDQSAGDTPGAVSSSTSQVEFVTSRSLRVIPSNNNPSGTYDLTLYYAAAEINGWAAMSGRSINDLEIVKSATDIGSATFLELFPPVIGAFGSDFTYKTSINTGFSGFALGNALIALPVEMNRFEAKAQEKSILLHWQTSSETNNRGFELLRSTSPSSGFSPIAWMNGQGTRSEPTNYFFDDIDVKTNTDYYYQLQQIDEDGQASLSEIVTARLEAGAAHFQIAPNPVRQQLQVQFETSPQTGHLRIIDFLGKTVYQQIVNQEQSIDLFVHDLAKGVYWLEFVNEAQQVYVEKFLKLE
ncbi:MAG: T9SS type A sorting domain-containing protein, partial [Bacteroidota bacterium]